jgi:hypothetical protein
MSDHPAGKLNIRGSVFEIFVDDSGNWAAYDDGYRVSAITRDGLKEILLRRTKQAAATVGVRFTCLSRSRLGTDLVRHGTATGIHTGNGNLLVTWSDGKKEQFTDRYGVTVVRELTVAELAQWEALRAEAKRAAQKLEAFVAGARLDLEKATKQAIEIAMQGGHDEEKAQ